MITIDYKRLDIRPGDRILDIGCGQGRHVAGACEYSGITVVGADISFSDLKQARVNIDAHELYGKPFGGNWSVSVASILNLPFADRYFDHVICSEVMEHIPDDRDAARELNRVLKPGGSMTISVPRYLPERICWALSDAYSKTEGGHVRIYKKTEICGIFEDMGLECRCHHYAHSLHSPYWWLKCIAGLGNESALPVRAYHRFLTWDLMKKPRLTRFMETLMNPVLGKSLVLYFIK